jgi:hypothetical protein
MTEKNTPEGKPDLLLHVCCAPCSTYSIESLKRDYRVTALFYGPNIHPEVEYIVRLEEMERYAQISGVEMIRAEYDMVRWFEEMNGFESESYDGERCGICYHIRLEKTAEYAVEKGFRHFSTTLTVSPGRDAAKIARAAREVGERRGLEFRPLTPSEDVFRRCLELSRRFDLYRQDYCGCVFSRRDRDRNLRSSAGGLANVQHEG